MMRYRLLGIAAFLALTSTVSGQEKREQEYRITSSEFPKQAFSQVSPYLQDSKRIRFYKEIDGQKSSFEVKFKKDKLHYSVEFDPQGELEDVEFIIQKNDIPEDSWKTIKQYLDDEFGKVRIKRMQQQYPNDGTQANKVLQDAFQNLILPYINYEIVFSTKGKKGFQTYEGLFNAKGESIGIRKSLPSNYDHILY